MKKATLKSVTVKIPHRTLGVVSVKVDAEDKEILMGNSVRIETFSGTQSPKVRIGDGNERQYAARMILEKHNMLVHTKNVFYKGNSLDLTKKNLFQTV